MKIITSYFVKINLAIALTIFFVAPVFAQPSVVVPNIFTNTDGDGNNIFPFSCGFFVGLDSQRYQQVYLGSQLGSGNINRISFRLEGNGQGFGPTTLPGVHIKMSTTQSQPGNLSPTFADNVGPDDTVVFSGDLTLSAPDCTTSPCQFDIDIPLASSFQFDPALGNLLVDIRISDCVNLGDFVHIDATGDSGSITSRLVSIDSVNNPTGFPDDVGLITQFFGLKVTRPIPTLSEWGMITTATGLGLVGVFFAVRRRRAVAK